MNINRLIRKNIRGLHPYEAKELRARAKLDANESPYEFPELLKEALNVKTNRYPDPQGTQLKRAASKRWKVKPENILLGNGSDELIYYLVLTFGGPVMYPTPTFSMYEIITKAIGEKAVGVRLDRDFDLNTERFLEAIKKHKPKLIFLSSPNNPTGNCFSTDRIFQIIQKTRGLVVVDEAYQPFSSKNGFVPFLESMENLVIMRTLSKIGFASLRVGFLLAHKPVIEAVNRVRLPFNLNALSQAVAIEVFKNYRTIQSGIKKIVKERERLYSELQGIKKIRVYPSEANFILFSTADADKLHRGLARRGVLVRNMTSAVKNSLRVTIGTREENDLFLNTLKSLIR
ncbi:MAG: histidinol-phosphate transaminase [Nitrospirae bacterium]|nr:MAG: histidinol-phosphate transaminase [Nitrospirota bacterium]